LSVTGRRHVDDRALHRLGLGIMIEVWGYCTEHEKDTLTRRELRFIGGNPKVFDWILAADLAEVDPEDENSARIRGAEGRLFWLQKRRKAAQKGGIATAKGRVVAVQKPAKDLRQKPSGGGADEPREKRPMVMSMSTSMEMSKDVVGRAKRAGALPQSWKATDAHARLASDLSLDLAGQSAQFRDYNLSKGRTMKDWDAAFRNWLRKAGEWAKEKPGGSVPKDYRPKPQVLGSRRD